MKVKNVVKVMNFHSLLRVDKARKEAEKYFIVEKELRKMIDSITNNRNIVLDKQVVETNPENPALDIYIGSDLGFCGSYNYGINFLLRNDTADKILIGKKVRNDVDDVVYFCTKEEYMENPEPVADYIKKSINRSKYSEINVLYNCYRNISSIEIEKKRLFPFDASKSEDVSYTEDYISESDITELVVNMISAYVDFEIQITIKNALASENIMRQNSTGDSLRKIDELEEKKAEEACRLNSLIASEKNVERYIRRTRKMKKNG